MSSMRAVTVTEFGSPGVLEIREVPLPDPGPGKVRIAVAAAGVNPVDAYNVEDPSWAGVELGFIPGYDIAGTVDAVGAGVDPTLIGRRAIAMTAFPQGQGGYAEFAVVDEALVGYLEDDADLQAAASIPLAAGTAFEVVGKVADAGPHVLVIGASGGVGLFALQFARHRDLLPVALGRSRNHEVMRECGAEHCVDYNASDAIAAAASLAGGTFDAIIDLVGGSLTQQAQPYLRDDGVICAIATPELDVDGLIDHNQSFHGLLIRDNGQRMRTIAELYTLGRLTTHVTAVFPLEQAAEAQRLLASGAAGGKVVLAI